MPATMPVIRAAEPRITAREGYNLASPQHPSSQYPELVSEHPNPSAAGAVSRRESMDTSVTSSMLHGGPRRPAKSLSFKLQTSADSYPGGTPCRLCRSRRPRTKLVAELK